MFILLQQATAFCRTAFDFTNLGCVDGFVAVAGVELGWGWWLEQLCDRRGELADWIWREFGNGKQSGCALILFRETGMPFFSPWPLPSLLACSKRTAQI